MRSLIIDIYKIVFRLTKVKGFAIGVALVYMTVLNMVMIYGLGLLMEGWLPFMSLVHTLYSFPYYIVTAPAVFGVTYWLMPPISTIMKESKKEANPLALIIYTFFTLVLFAYIKYGDKIF